MSLTRLRAVARKEALHLRRDARSLVLAFLLPVLLTILFGYAISWDVDDIEIAVLDQDRIESEPRAPRRLPRPRATSASRRFSKTADCDPRRHRSRRRADGAGHSARISAGDLGRPLQDVRADPGRSSTVATPTPPTSPWAMPAASCSPTRSAVAFAGRGVRPPIRAESRVWYNEELSSRNMIVPGLVAVIMMIIAAMLTSLTIAREWERGTMEQLAATPVTRTEVVLGKMLPYVGIGLFDVLAVSAIGVLALPSAVPGKPAPADGALDRVSRGRARNRDAHLRRHPIAGTGHPGRHGRDLPSLVSPLGLHVRREGHAARAASGSPTSSPPATSWWSRAGSS